MLLNGLVDVNGIQCRYIKPRQPHIHHNSNLKVGFYIFKLPVIFLAVILGPQHFIKSWLIILVSGHDELNFFDRLQLFFLFVAQFHTVRADFFLRPFRPQPNHDLVKIIGNFAVGADKHRFPGNSSSLGNTGLIVADEIFGYCAEPVRVTDDSIDMSHRFLAFLNLMLVCAFYRTLGIVILNFLYLGLVQSNLGRSSVVHQIDSDPVLDGFGHGVGIYHRAEYLDGTVHRRTSETDISSIGQGIVEIFGKAVFAFYTVFRHLYLLVEVDLAAVGFVGNADHIRSVGQQFQILGEFLDGGQVHTATGSALQLLPKGLAGINAYYRFIANVLFGGDELFGKLVV